MRPNKDSREVISNLTGEEVEMGLDPNAAAHLMGVLTNLYDDPALAALREAATNALDSHIEAGNDAPIEVELPTYDEPTLTIRDNGLGLNAQDFREIYVQYGASTKRESDKVTGILGLGCKAPLAYTDQFTVIGIKDEIRTTVSISRGAEGGGTMTIVSEEEVPFRPNGVEVIIPVQGNTDFERKAADLFRFWDEGTVLVNGEAPTRVQGIQITDDILAIEGGGYGSQDYIVMGNVPYETSFGYSGLSLVVKVPMGTVDFAPDREGLLDSNRTQEARRAIKREFEAHREEALQAQVDEATTKQEALANYVSFRWLAPNGSPTWSGEQIPKVFRYGVVGNVQMRFLKEHQTHTKGFGKANCDEMSSISAPEAYRGIWITGYTNHGWTAGNRDRVDAFASLRGRSGKGSIITPEDAPPHSDWLDPLKIIEWKELCKWYRKTHAAPKIPGAGPQQGPTSYTVWTADEATHMALATDLDTEAPIFYELTDRHTSANQHREKFPEGTQVVYLKRNQVKKFLRLFPHTKTTSEGLHELAKDWWKGLSDEDRKQIQWDGDDSVTDALDTITPEQVLDPELSELLKVKANRIDDTLMNYLDSEPKAITFEHLEERYPLIAVISSYEVTDGMPEHALLYVNQVYTQIVSQRRES